MTAGHTLSALVVPCFNERQRINLAAFAAGAEKNGLRILFVDDGSTDGTADLIRESVRGHPRLRLHACPQNRGKAAVVREGLLHLAEEHAGEEWVGFWDADLSTPLAEVGHMLRFRQMEGGEYGAIWGSRVMRGGSRISRKFNRHLFGRIFATAAGAMLGVRVYDTQCGAKLFRREIVPGLFQEEFISRWIFDVELYCRLGHDQILECPVRSWTDTPDSRVRVVRDSCRVVSDLFRIKRRYRRLPGRHAEGGA